MRTDLSSVVVNPVSETSQPRSIAMIDRQSVMTDVGVRESWDKESSAKRRNRRGVFCVHWYFAWAIPATPRANEIHS
jgi:hypothetical protein